MVLKIHKLAYRLVLVMLFLLPFHAFGTVVLNYGIGLNEIFGKIPVVNLWKEILLIILTLLLGMKCFTQYREHQNSAEHQHHRKIITLDWLDGILGGYILFGLIQYISLRAGFLRLDVQSPGFSQFILGLKYDVTFLYAFLLAKHFHFSRKEIETMIKAVLIGGGVSILTSYLLYFVIKQENLVALGFRNDWSTWLPHQSLAFCQKIEHQNLCRMSGTFAGPNQFGAYLTLLFPLIFLWYQRRKDFFQVRHPRLAAFLRSPWTVIFTAVISLGALVLTFSRGALIGTIGASTWLIITQTKLKKHFFKILLPLGAVSLLIVAMAFAFDVKFITRQASTLGHMKAWQMGIQEMVSHPFGQGIGSSGPASSYTSHPIIPESWYLQVGIETGFLGLSIFVSALASIVLRLWKKQEFVLLASFLGVSAIALFLHTFEDAPTSITLFWLVGLVLGQKTEGKETQL